ncbi:MAG: hypothetical protein ACREGI_02765, partial [Candidatus Levyibacteriota bacterium]
SIGGNNIGIVLQGNFDEKRIDEITSKDLSQIKSKDINYLNSFVDNILATIAGYENDLFGLLEQYYSLYTLGITFNHIFVKSLPNLGLCDHVTFISKDDAIPSFRIELDSPFKKVIATAISKRFNIAMARAIERFKKAHIMNAPQVILLDLFHLLQAEDLDGIHPTIGGQVKIAQYQEERMDFDIFPRGRRGQ